MSRFLETETSLNFDGRRPDSDPQAQGGFQLEELELGRIGKIEDGSSRGVEGQPGVTDRT